MCYLEVMDYKRQFLVQNDSVDPKISSYGDKKHGLRQAPITSRSNRSESLYLRIVRPAVRLAGRHVMHQENIDFTY